MRRFLCTFLFIVPMMLFQSASAQVDDVSDATGLPIPIGAPVIYGQVEIRGLPKGQRKPAVFVMLLDRGIQAGRVEANDRGYFFFLQRPQNAMVLVYEVDGKEVGRQVVTSGISNRVRMDVALNWAALEGAQKSVVGTISARDRYERTESAEKAFEKAMQAARGEKPAEAIKQFEAIVAADPNDHFAWTMLGTLHMTAKKNADAEQAFQRAVALKPEFGLALVNYGKLMIAQKNFDKAVELLEKAVEADERSAEANHMLGEAHLQAKRGSKAVGYLNRAIELAPEEKADIHLRLAALYNGAGLKDRAAAEYKIFLEKKPDHPEAKTFRKYVEENLPKQ